MHIVYVCREYPPAKRMGGIAAYLKEISVAMAKRGHIVTVIAASDDTRHHSDEKIDGVRVIRLKGGDFVIPTIETSFSKIKKFRAFYRFYSYRRRVKDTIISLGDVDVIEIAEYGAEGYYLDNLDIPITMRLHTPTLLDRETGKTKPFSLLCAHEYWVGKHEEHIMTRFLNVTSCSKSLLEWCELNIPGFTYGGEVIYNPLDASKWISDGALNYEENTIFYAGTVAEPKGVGDLIEAVASIVADGRNVRLKIAGKIGSYGKTLKHYCQQRGYNWCEFLGHISREELMRYYSSCKVSCFPSWWEALGIVCLEAMSMGNVVVASNNGGMAEIITDGLDGYLIPPRDISAITSTLKKALDLGLEDIIRIRENARKRIRNKFSTEVIAAQLEEYYESISK